MSPEELQAEATSRGIKPPQRKTLAKYGIDDIRWLELLAAQGWKCAVCQKSRATWNTDHEHVPGWAKKPAEVRAIYVRGILCWHCNRHMVDSHLTSATARRVAEYIEAYEARRDSHDLRRR